MTFNPWTFALEVINFVVLAYVLYRLLYRPLHAAIDGRREAVKREQEEATKARADAETIKQNLQGQLAAIDRQREQIISEARAQAEAERKKILDEVDRAIERRHEQLELSIARERQETLQKLSGEIVNHAVQVAERILRQATNSELRTQLEKHLIEALDHTPEDQRQQMQREWQTEDQAWLQTAFAPNNEVLAQIRASVMRLAGKTLVINVQTHPALIGGVRLRIGGHLWDASIAGQLESVPAESTEVTNA